MQNNDAQPLKVALLGCGTVGTQVARLILEQGDDLTARIGRLLELVGIAVRNLDRPRPEVLKPLLTTDAAALVARGDLDIVIELIGGLDAAGELVFPQLHAPQSPAETATSDGCDDYAALQTYDAVQLLAV